MNDSKIGLSGDFTSPYVEASARSVQTAEKEKTMKEIHVANAALSADSSIQGYYPMTGEQWITADRVSSLEKQIVELAAEKEEMIRMLYGRDLEIERLAEALERIRAWANAYPLSVFPEPDFKRAAAVLKENGMTLDDISASNMRRVLDGVMRIAAEALGDEDE